jgi:hypothetical protein
MVEGMKMNITLKKEIYFSKLYDVKHATDTEIRVIVTSDDFENKKRHTIVFNPESKAFYDTISLIAYEDCVVTDSTRHFISDKDMILVIIVDLDDQ